MIREKIIDLYKHPHNKKKIKATHEAHIHNALCGDDVTVYLQKNGKSIEDASFEGTACTICTASASLLTDVLKGKSIKDVENMNKDTMLELLDIPISPVRLKCALLPLEATHKALGENNA